VGTECQKSRPEPIKVFEKRHPHIIIMATGLSLGFNLEILKVPPWRGRRVPPKFICLKFPARGPYVFIIPPIVLPSLSLLSTVAVTCHSNTKSISLSEV
jgi:hypothetical protein